MSELSTVRRRQLMLAEAPRTLAEMAMLSCSAPLLLTAPRGDGHPVLVMPGFGASDASTVALRGYLSGMGYRASPWTLGRNLGPAMPDLAAQLRDILEQTYRNGGERKVSLVGWSLGGVYARILAALFPDIIRSVITLGSPFATTQNPDHLRPLMTRLTQQYGSGAIEQMPVHQLRLLAAGPLQVPSSAVFSRTDAIVPWQMATQETGDITENIEVFASHTGLGFSPTVLYAVADRLALKAGQWQPFRPRIWQTALYGGGDLGPSGVAA